MARKPITRRARSFRLGMIFFLAAVIAVAGYVVYNSRRNRLVEVRLGEVRTGDVTAYMNITANLAPGNIQSATVSNQLVKAVYVRKGDHVAKDQLLVEFDLAPLEKNVEDAKNLRAETDKALAESTRVAQEMQASSATSALETVGQIAALQSSINSLLATFQDLSKSIDNIEQELDNPSFTLPSALPTLPSALPTLPSALPTLPSFPSLPSPTPTPTTVPTEPTPTPAPVPTEPTPSLTPVPTEPTEPTSATSPSLAVSRSGSVYSPPLTGALAAASATPGFDLSALGLSGSTGGISSQISSLLGSAQSTYVQALQAEDAAEKALANAVTELRAEFAGIVFEINATPGKTTPGASTGLSLNLGSSSEPTVTIYDDIHLKAVFNAGRTEAKKLEEGMIVEFIQDGVTYPGSIVYKAAVANGVSSGNSETDALFNLAGSATSLTDATLAIEMQISSHKPGDLLIGFPIEARIRVAEATATMIVPSEALKKELGKYYVYVYGEANTLRKVFIEAGIQSESYAQVVSGLQFGDKVVLNPSNNLADGMIVREKPATP